MTTEHHKQKIDRLYAELEKAEAERDSAEAELEKAEREYGYVNQSIALECLGFLDKAGCGQPGKPNTLWAMVKEIIDRAKEAEAEIVKLRDGAQAVFGTDLLSVAKLIETNKQLEAELADIRSTLEPVYHVLGIEYLGQLKSTCFALKDQLAELRDAMAWYFECFDKWMSKSEISTLQALKHAEQRLRQLGGEDG